MSRQLSRSSTAQAALAAVLVIGVLLLLVINGHDDDVREQQKADAEQASPAEAPRELAGGFTTITADEFFATLTSAQKESQGWHVAMATNENDETVSVVNQDVWMDGDRAVLRGTTEGPSGPVVMLSVDGSVYFKGLGDQARPWWKVPDRPAFAQLRALAEEEPFLDDVDDPDEFEVVGVEKIDGTAEDGSAAEVDALHYRVGVEAETYDTRGAAVPASVTMDVWVDVQDRPVQTITSYTVDGIRTETTLLYSDYGQVEQIKAPPPASVTRKVPAGYRPGQ